MALCLTTIIGCSKDEVACELAEAPLKRLTSHQYNQSVSDLFPELNLPLYGFPLETSVGGFSNNSSLNIATSSLVDAYHYAALDIASQAIAGVSSIDSCEEDRVCLLSWLKELNSEAWRRPLTDEEATGLEEMFLEWSEAAGNDGATQIIIQYILESPDFLYMPEIGNSDDGFRRLNSYEIATRMSYFLLNSIPDDELIQAAAQDMLQFPEVRSEQAWRLLSDEPARVSYREFVRQWLELDDIGSGSVDFEYFFPDMDEEDVDDHLYNELMPAMRYEPEVMVDQIVFEERGALEELYTADRTWITRNAAELHDHVISEEATNGVSWISSSAVQGREIEFEETFYPIDLNTNERMGILTLPGLMHARSHPSFPSPTLRGVFILNRVLCLEVSPPPDSIANTIPTDTEEPRTNRERYTNNLYEESCYSCHDSIDGIGFTFENYDSLGLFQSLDNGYDVDATGELIGTDVDGHISNAIDLTSRLSRSRTAHDCMVTQTFRYAHGRVETEDDTTTISTLQEQFWDEGGDILSLLVNIVEDENFVISKEVE